MAYDATSRGAESGADANLLFSRCGARQHQVGDIDTRDHEDQRDRGQQQKETRAHIADHLVLQWNHADVRVPFFRHAEGKEVTDMRLEHLNLSSRLRESCTRAQSRDYWHVVAGPRTCRITGVNVQRNPYLCFRGRKSEVCGHDAKHLAAHAIDFNGASGDGAVTAETLLPKCVTEDDVVVLSGSVFAGEVDPA